METYILVLDAGTGAGRCAIVDQEGQVRKTAYQEWGYEQDPHFPEHTHFDAQAFFDVLLDLARRVIQDAGISPGQVHAVTVTSLREGVIFI